MPSKAITLQKVSLCGKSNVWMRYTVEETKSVNDNQSNKIRPCFNLFSKGNAHVKATKADPTIERMHENCSSATIESVNAILIALLLFGGNANASQFVG